MRRGFSLTWGLTSVFWQHSMWPHAQPVLEIYLMPVIRLEFVFHLSIIIRKVMALHALLNQSCSSLLFELADFNGGQVCIC